jgi:hypothetical protein
MTKEAPRYMAYMLRLWRANTGAQPVWRASLESPHTGERLGFASLEALFVFLVEKTGGVTHRAQPWAESERSEKGVKS